MDESQRKKVLLLLFAGVLMAALDIAIIGPALPAMQADFSMNTRQLSWLFSVYILCQLVATPLLAKMSDRFGRRQVYVFCVTGFALGSLMLVLSPSVEVLLVGRAVQGFSAGGIFPVASAVIGDTFPREKRGGALGLIGAVFGLAFLIGPVLGGILLRWSWHWLFLINLPIAAVLAWKAFSLLPATGAAELKPLDFKGALTLSGLLVALAVAVTNLDSSNLAASLTSTDVWPWAVAFVILLPLFWRIEKTAADPIVHESLLSSRQLKLTVAIALGVGTVESATVFFPALAVAALGVTESNAAWLMMPMVAAMTVTSPVVGRILDRSGSRMIVQFGLVCVFVGVMVYSLADITLTLFIVAGVLGGIGMAALLGAPFRYIVLHEAGAEHRAAAQGLLTVFMSVGQLLGAAIVGGVAASRGGGVTGYQAGFLVLGILSGIMLLVAFGLKSRAVEQAEIEAHEAASS